MAELTENEIATINAILQQQAGGAMSDQERQALSDMQSLQNQRYGLPIEQPIPADDALIEGRMMLPQEYTEDRIYPENFGALPQEPRTPMPPQQGGSPYNMSTEQGKAQYLQQQIEAIKARMGGGAPQTGSQRVMKAMGALPQQQMMRGQR